MTQKKFTKIFGFNMHSLVPKYMYIKKRVLTNVTGTNMSSSNFLFYTVNFLVIKKEIISDI